ncbi:MAG: DUF2007 domain-containing protein [Flavobacteriaceae bacterium]|jgi:hypothetical protein
MNKYDFILVFEGSLVKSIRIIHELNKSDINPLFKNQSESARLAGFGNIIEDHTSVYVHKDEIDNSKKIINNLGI